MKKFIKLLIGSTMMISAFLFGAFVFTTHAEEAPAEPTTSEVVETETPAEDDVIDSKEVDKIVDTTNSFMAWVKQLDMKEVKTWIIALMGKLGIDTALVLYMLIYVVRSKLKEAKETQFYKDLMAKMSAEHQKEIEDLIKSFDEKLEKVNANVIESIKKQNSEKRELAKNNVDEMRAALGEIKVNLDE